MPPRPVQLVFRGLTFPLSPILALELGLQLALLWPEAARELLFVLFLVRILEAGNRVELQR